MMIYVGGQVNVPLFREELHALIANRMQRISTVVPERGVIREFNRLKELVEKLEEFEKSAEHV